ncbi:MAG: DUF2023 family protein [Bacteroidales bacterium]|nr:DUF2023 family protein [Bacteroidales bacterium]
MNSELVSAELMVLSNHIYEYKKGVRNLILFTLTNRQVSSAVEKLQRQNIDYIVQTIGSNNVNIFFGKKECLDAIRMFVDRPLSMLSPEEDFILGALLGYDVCRQCERFCERKRRV